MIRPLCLIAALALTAGCLTPGGSAPEIAWYSLAAPSREPLAAQPLSTSPVQVLHLANLSPGRTKLIRRASPYRVAIDEYRRWLEPPETAIGRDLYLALCQSNLWPEVRLAHEAPADLLVTGTIVEFGLDAEGQAVCAINLKLTRADGQPLVDRLYTQARPLPAGNPDAVAAAMSTAVGDILAAFLADCQAALTTSK